MHTQLLTCNWGVNGPGSMLLVEEYIFGVCLSQKQHTHSVDGERSCSPGKFSEHVEHIGEFREEK